ncbi:MAG TPA: PPOX class F420-dependent oxidoreductase [Anaerolineales bacterium]|nr:PPOX class F420-dependent oxidoreductase [Anaerolineales bacterium]
MTNKTFTKQNYINIESRRKDGTPVRTPVWFAEEGGALHVWTQANSGKAKRIRRNDRIRITPCQADGTPLDEWAEARAEAEASSEALQRVQSLLRKKYGIAFLFFKWMGRKHNYTELRIYPKDSV